MNISTLIDLLKWTFVQRAIIVGVLIAVSSSLIGVFLVLRRYSMIGDGLAHVSFGSVAVAILFNQSPLLVSLPIVVGASLLILKLSEENRLGGDAVIGLIASTAMAFGLMITSLNQGFNVDLDSYLFGSILLLSAQDVVYALMLTVIVVFVITRYYHALFAMTYDQDFAKIRGYNTARLNQMIAVLISLIIVLGMRVVGTLLISSLLIFPTVNAMNLARSFKASIVLAFIFSLLSVLIGIMMSLMFDLPTGSSIVLVNAAVFVITSIIRKVRGE